MGIFSSFLVYNKLSQLICIAIKVTFLYTMGILDSMAW